jgi:hypothetical protein
MYVRLAGGLDTAPEAMIYPRVLMPRRSLRPELNRIRGWVRQGRTDAWIAHQLDATVQQIEAFKREQALELDSDSDAPVAAVDYDDEIDLRAEDDALIAAELDAEALAAAEAAPEPDAEPEEDGEDRPKRRRGRRGGGSRRRRGPLEATFDHGEEGYGMWLDPAVQDDPVYAEHWAGHRPVVVVIEEDQIVIRRAGEPEPEAEETPAEPTVTEPEPTAEAEEEKPKQEKPKPKPRPRAKPQPRAKPKPKPKPEEAASED